jgi:hypothetical protein
MTRVQPDSVAAALRSIAIQHWLSVAALVSALVVPLVGVWLLRRAAERTSVARASAIWASGCFSLMVYAGAALVFGVCGGGEVGESGKTRLARALGAPVIRALDTYHGAHGGYPSSLRELVPAYLSASALHAPERSPLGYPFAYESDGGGYELWMSYTGPGMNTCRYRPGSRWQCTGYF